MIRYFLIIGYLSQGGDIVKVYERVWAYIDGNGLNPTVVAREAGISPGVFQAMMNGKRTIYADDLRAICYALHVSPETFIKLKSA